MPPLQAQPQLPITSKAPPDNQSNLLQRTALIPLNVAQQTMGQGDFLQYIRPGKSGGFGSPARPGGSGGVGGFTNGIRPHGVVIARPIYDSLGRPIQSRTLNPTSTLPIPTSKPGAEEGENFTDALNAVKFTSDDYQRLSVVDANKDMLELLSGAIGDGEHDDVKDGDDQVDGFANGVKLMPHQVRGTKWMKARETGRKNGGILADVSLRVSSEITKWEGTTKETDG